MTYSNDDSRQVIFECLERVVHLFTVTRSRLDLQLRFSLNRDLLTKIVSVPNLRNNLLGMMNVVVYLPLLSV